MGQRGFTVGSLIPGKIVPLDKDFDRKNPVTPSINPEKIIVQQSGAKFEITSSKGKLLDAALNQGKAIKFKCRKGTCGQCTVKVLQGAGLSTPNKQEYKKLNKEISNGFRLACQVDIL